MGLLGNVGSGAAAGTAIAPGLGTIIGAGAGLVGGVLGDIFQGSANKKERQWQEMMYGRQRADALADWNMQNAYNAPSAQMARLKAAGLNPNLVYGNGTVATGSSGSVRSSSTGSYHPQALQDPIGNAVSNALSLFYDMQVKQAQVENLHANNELIKSATDKNVASAESMRAGIPYVQSKTHLTDQLFGYRTESNPLALEQAKENIRKTQVFTDVALSQNERQQAMLAPNLKIAAQRVLNMRMEVIRMQMENEVDVQKIQNMKTQLQFLAVQAAKLNSETDLNLSELKFREQGQTWKDSWIGRFIQGVGNSFGDLSFPNPLDNPNTMDIIKHHIQQRAAANHSNGY